MLSEHTRNILDVLHHYHNAIGDAIETIRLLSAENEALKREIARHTDTVNDLLRDKYGSHH